MKPSITPGYVEILNELEKFRNDLNRLGFDEIYMDLACSLAKRSTCSRLHVGCVVVSDDNQRVLSIGYNGGAKKIFNDCLSDEPGKCGHLHAEMNALIKLNYNEPVKKKMYVTVLPCFQCSVAIVNASIDEVIYLNDYRLTDGLELLHRANIKVRKYEEV